jgi:hypothetical protein
MMRTILCRAAVVSVVQLLLFELLEQLEVRLDWRESTRELAGFGQAALLVAGTVWTVLPVRRHPQWSVLTIALGIVLFVGLDRATYVYSWHIRPNIGLYREPGWVAQHPGFQRELRERVERNRWSGSKQPSQSTPTPNAVPSTN